VAVTQGERWAIFYDDGHVCTSLYPWNAPRRNVLAIASVRDEGRPDESSGLRYDLLYGSEYYYFEYSLGGWRQCDIFTLWEHLMRATHPLVIFGKMMRDTTWVESLKRIRAWCDAHTDWLTGETHEPPPQSF
jgi:hypothetical protein